MYSVHVILSWCTCDSHMVCMCASCTQCVHVIPGGNVTPSRCACNVVYFREEAPDRSKLFSQHESVHTQSQLPAKRMAESYQEVVIPLSSQPELQEKYINWFKTIRIGKILEDLDTFAGKFSSSNPMCSIFDKDDHNI